MFKNEYQGGAVVEIFSAQGKDPVAKWKLCGGQSAISKEFDKEVKGFVYNLEGSSQTHKMQIPKDGKIPLGLIQKFLVLQVNVPLGKDFSTELLVTDLGHLKRRLYLSTVHKDLSATPLHARIPLTSLRRNVWSNICIDLASFTGEMFRGAGFLSLDGISISACCKVRRIFTMKTKPADSSDGDLYRCRDGPRDEIPRTCQFPLDVQYITQVVNMERLGMVDIKTGPLTVDVDHTGSARAATARGPKTHDPSHIAFGSRVAGPPPLTSRKTSAPSNGQEARTELSLDILSGRSGNLQPRPPPERSSSERAGSRRPRFHSAGREKTVPKGSTPCPSRDGGASPQRSAQNPGHPPLSPNWTEGDTEADELTLPVSVEDGSSLDSSGSAPKRLLCESACGLLPPMELKCMSNSDVSDTEPQFPLEEEEEVFTFSSRPHSARRGQGHSEPTEDPTFNPNARDQEGGEGRKDARLEDDFIGSESEEDEVYSKFLFQRCAVRSSPGPPLSPDLSDIMFTSSTKSPIGLVQTNTITTEQAMSHCSSAGSRWSDQVSMVPTRCLSPSGIRPGNRPGQSGTGRHGPDGDTRTSLSRRSLQEIPPGDFRFQKMSKGRRIQPVASSGCDLRRQEEEEEELRMLASLCREQEEEEGVGSPELSASRVHHCNVSLSTSSDDTSTWTQCIPMPANQGQHYQKEMNPLLHSNPREWMDVLSPPIIPPSQQRSEAKGDHNKVTTKGAEVPVSPDEEEFLNLLYDPCLNCYFDPQSGKYYELA